MKFSHITPEDLAADITMFVISALDNNEHTREFIRSLGKKQKEVEEDILQNVLARLHGSADV